MIRAILLDIDNTLLNFDAYVQTAMKEGFEQFGLGEYTAETYQIFLSINGPLWHALEQKEITYQELLQVRWNKIFQALGITFDGLTFEKYFKGRLFHTAIPETGAMELLTHLQGRYVLAAASNGPFDQQINRLKLAGMYDKMEYHFISEAMGVAKPAKEYFAHCVKVINEGRPDPIQPQEILMIGDSLSSDIAGAKAFGMQTCFYDKHQKGDEKGIAPDFTVTRLEQILEVL
ncbi:MAG: HAD-IA family hydrolase [Clostridia bacterium]|nr:HAD-IA family hydrolase [Clostridia bacterium]